MRHFLFATAALLICVAVARGGGNFITQESRSTLSLTFANTVWMEACYLRKPSELPCDDRLGDVNNDGLPDQWAVIDEHCTEAEATAGTLIKEASAYTLEACGASNQSNKICRGPSGQPDQSGYKIESWPVCQSYTLARYLEIIRNDRDEGFDRLEADNNPTVGSGPLEE